MSYSDELLTFTTRLVFSTDGMTNDLKVYWGKMLSFFYSSKYSQQQIRHKEMQSAAIKFKSDQAGEDEFSALQGEDQALAIVFLKLLVRQAELFDQPIANEKLSVRIQQLTQKASADASRLIDESFGECLQMLSRHENRRKIIVSASILPVTIDYVGRWILLIICQLNEVERGSIIGFNFLFSVFSLGLIIWKSYADGKHNRQLFQKRQAVADFKIGFQLSAGKYTWLAFFFLSSLIVTYLLGPEDEPMPIRGFVLVGFMLCLQYITALRFFPSGRASEVEVIRQVKSRGTSLEKLNADKNDEVMVLIETEINSRTGRLDAYVLESALFGALAFSGFLQVLSSDSVSFKELELFSSLVSDLVRNFVNMHAAPLLKTTGQLYTKPNLFCLAAIETLLCSGLFIAVIASRLRFSNVADKVRRPLEIAKAYNGKEELWEQNKNSAGDYRERLTLLNRKVNEQLHISQSALEEINPISGYMEYFRNAGLFMFLMVLISCSLFVTSFLGWLYVGIGAATWMYFNSERILAGTRELTLLLQISFIKKSALYLLAAVVLIAAGFVLRISFGFERTQILITSGFILAGIYLFFWFVILPHYDERFGEIEKSSDALSAGRWDAIQVVFGFIILTAVSLIPFFSEVTDAFTFFTFTMMTICLLNLVVGYYCSKIKWLGIVLCVIFLFDGGVVIAGLNPANFSIPIAAMVFGTGSAFIPYLVTRIWRNQFHRLLRSLFAFCTILTVLLAVPLIISVLSSKNTFLIPNYVTTLYQHKTYQLDSLATWLDFQSVVNPGGKRNPEILLKRAKSYQHHYGKTNGHTFAYGEFADQLYLTADTLLNSYKKMKVKDSLRLKDALHYAREGSAVLQLFEYEYTNGIWSTTEADILVELKRKKEAMSALNQIIGSKADERVKKGVRKRLKEIEENKPSKE